MITLILLILLLVYVLLVVLLIVGWNRATAGLSGQTAAMAGAKPLVTVVVPARNEESQISLLMADLKAQRYPDFEVIIIDDNSDDRTMKFCRNAIEQDHRFLLITASGAGKKNALSEGVQRARGSLIVTTDADCRVGANWLSTLASQFQDPELKLCFGGVTITGRRYFDRMQSLEFATLVGTGAATAAWRIPTMCNAANMAYRKSAFEAVGGYTDNLQIPSGDDEFLMRKINHAYPQSISYCPDPEATVTTQPSSSLKQFFFQRIRWAGKWQSNTDTTTKLLAIFIFVFHVAVVALPWLVATNIVAPMAAVTALLTKAAVELIFISWVQSTLTRSWWGAFLSLQVVYSYYVVFVAVCAPFITFEWKGRRLKPFMVRSQ